MVHYCIVHIFPRRSIILWTKRRPGSRTRASRCIRKPNEPQYQEHTFPQESSCVSDLETCVMWTQTSQLITLSRNNIDNRKSVFLLSESNENTLFATLCCLWIPREFELFNGRWFYTFLLVRKAARDKINQVAQLCKKHVEAFQSTNVAVIILRCRTHTRLGRKSAYFKRWLEYSNEFEALKASGKLNIVLLRWERTCWTLNSGTENWLNQKHLEHPKPCQFIT